VTRRECTLIYRSFSHCEPRVFLLARQSRFMLNTERGRTVREYGRKPAWEHGSVGVRGKGVTKKNRLTQGPAFAKAMAGRHGDAQTRGKRKKILTELRGEQSKSLDPRPITDHCFLPITNHPSTRFALRPGSGPSACSPRSRHRRDSGQAGQASYEARFIPRSEIRSYSLLSSLLSLTDKAIWHR